MASNDELLSRVYSIIGSERDTGLVRPLVLAMATLAYRDLAIFLIDNDSEMAKKLVTTVANQTWANSQFAAPANMLFHKQNETTRLDLGGVLAYQLRDRDALNLLVADVTKVANHYYALEGKTFFIKHSGGTTGASNLNLTYYKIPTITDIDSEMMNTLLELLIPRLVPHSDPNFLKENDKPQQPNS